MSAPDDSNSKAPPSLLSSDAGKGSGANNSRILANLEGRVSPQTENAPRSRKGPIALVALAVVAVAGWGAWRLQQPSIESAEVAASAPAAVVPASHAVPASAVQIAQAPAPQPATIVNDDSIASDAKPAAAASAVSESRLSRALANGASDVSTTGAAAGATAAAVAVAAAKPAKSVEKSAAKSTAAKQSKQDAAHAKAEAAARKRHEKTQAAQVAQAKKARHEAAAKKNGKDDPDADLLAALVARTKPAGAAKSGEAAKSNATPKMAAAAATGSADASLAARVKVCGERGFFEDQLCRWRVCENHWGKDPACPTSATQNRQP
ncbi:phage tail protein [Burkholderia thailandensis]|uniref:phage tail protein n=1 Tax=Burkholderia thailandensis TaxID=57975 RepID=UPI0022AC057B|nr:phage tail protein [Burkholderia thailandensis]MCZ2901166.1 phage tail protein [Burkholderia thailandensis]MDD1481282.1 phage tail protein [Burkholderia thailandensis]MDD1487947.1 phage tail protein [Burkholderia thailandensis]MDD1494241.1 phage tail protein [Burkholderia thailandensis]